MPVTKSAKKALRVSQRRHQENLEIKDQYKRAIKNVRKAVSSGTEEVASLMSSAQRSLDTAAKSKTIHANKASRLKSRLAKLIRSVGSVSTPEKQTKKTTAKPKAAAKKPAAKKIAKKK